MHRATFSGDAEAFNLAEHFKHASREAVPTVGVEEVEHHRAEDQAADTRPLASGAVEHTEGEDGEDARGDIALDFLDVTEDGIGVQRCCHDATHHCEDHRDDTAGEHERTRLGIRLDVALEDIHREEGGSRIKHCGEGGDDCTEEGCEYEAEHTLVLREHIHQVTERAIVLVSITNDLNHGVVTEGNFASLTLFGELLDGGGSDDLNERNALICSNALVEGFVMGINLRNDFRSNSLREGNVGLSRGGGICTHSVEDHEVILGVFTLVELFNHSLSGVTSHLRRAEVECNDARDHDDEGDDELEGCGEHDTLLTVSERARAEDALGDVLVETPIVEVGDPDAHDEDGPRHCSVGSRTAHVHLGSIEVVEAFEDACGIRGGCTTEAGEFSCGGFAEVLDGEVGNHAATHDEGCALDEVCPCAGLEATEEHVGTRNHRHDNATGGEVNRNTKGIEKLEHHERTCVGHADERSHNQDANHGDGHQGASHMVVAHFQEFRHRGDASLQEVGEHAEGHDHERDGSNPFPRGARDAFKTSTLTRHADELFGRDVGGNQREADEPPAQTTTSEEVIFGIFFAFRLLATAALKEADKEYTRDKAKED